ncbi:MAG: metallophosphoesterase [Lachnospiraceae bacterium]|nr:metallophosphoesterase [Lachnospiraceae bacterium]
MIENILIVFAVLVVFIVIDSFYENRHFKITGYDIKSSKIPEGFEGFKLVVLSDLHNHVYGKANESLVEAIKKEKPDMVIFAGDILTAYDEGDFTPALSLVERIAGEFPSVMAFGNHEYRMVLYPEKYKRSFSEYRELTKKAGATWLDNETLFLERGQKKLAITGLRLDKAYYGRLKLKPMDEAYLDSICPFNDRSIFQILLAHNPDYFPNYAEYGADLVISGHVHGGMIRLPFLGGVVSPMLKLFPKYDRGLYESGGSNMILSAGLGNHSIKMRINNPAELVVINLHSR